MKKILVFSFVIAAAFFAIRLTHTDEAGSEQTISEKAGSENADSAKANSGVLDIGSPAPAIDIEHWVQNRNGNFQPFTQFKSGKVYVIEFWATWCGPCIEGMPHLAKLQDEYADKGVQIISITHEELETVTEFLKGTVPASFFDENEGGDETPSSDTAETESVTYNELTSAYCLAGDPDESVYIDYMSASGNSAIPTAFIVGKSGVIEWIGNAADLDEPLAKVVSDQWDRTIWTKARALEADIYTLFDELHSLTEAKKYQAVLSRLADIEEELPYLREEYVDGIRPVELMALIGLKKVEQAKAVFPKWKAIIENAGPQEIDGPRFMDFAKQMFSAASDGDKVEPALGEMAVFVANKAIAVLEHEGISTIEDGGKSMRIEEADPVVIATAMQDMALMMAKIGQATEAIAVQKKAIELVHAESRDSYDATLQKIIERSTSAAEN